MFIFIDIEYKFSNRTTTLVATGWLTGGREYAIGADPFKLPRNIRNVALKRFGFDFDDEAKPYRYLRVPGWVSPEPPPAPWLARATASLRPRSHRERDHNDILSPGSSPDSEFRSDC